MRSKISFFNGTIFRKNLSHYWPIWTLYLIGLICMIPVRIFLLTCADPSYTAKQLAEARTSSYMYVLSNSLSVIVCFVIAVASAMAVFYYLYNTRSAQTYHSFPIRREELFVTNYLSGFLFYTVPNLLTLLVGVFVCVARGITSLEYLLIWVLLMEGMTFFFYNMTILIGMFTGLLVAVPVFCVIANCIYVVCRYVVVSVLGIIGYGLSDLYAERSISILSPLLFMMSKVNISTDWSNSLADFRVYGGKYVAIYVVVGILFGIAAFFLYRKRRIETTGDVFSVSFLKPVFRWGGAAFLGMFGAVVLESVITVRLSAAVKFWLIVVCTAVIGLFAFFLLDMILQKSARVFTKKKFLEFGIYTLAVFGFLSCLELNVFGLENKMPDAADVRSVDMQLYYSVYETSPDQIEDVLAIQKQIIDSKKEFEAYERKADGKNIGWVQFNYTLMDGTPYTRNYAIPIGEDAIADENSVVAKIRKKSCDVDSFLRGNVCMNLDETEITGMSVDVYNEDAENHDENIAENDTEAVLEALKQDVAEGHLLYGTRYAGNGTYYQDPDNDKVLFWNSLTINLYNKNGVHTIWTERYSYGQSESDMVGLAFNKNCTHLIETLKKLGIVNDTDKRLLTGAEYQKLVDE
ncbi:MAG: hypothetical protein MR425_03175 [Lachnospiraceae bacterium]|nr:hypothetical protein [Lachnospiraceae bacterium]